MPPDQPTPHTPSWQDALDAQLLQRLWQRARHPGVTHLHLARSILGRLHSMMRPLPVLAEITQRYSAEVSEGEQVPIVYGQARPDNAAPAVAASTVVHAASSRLVVVQAQPAHRPTARAASTADNPGSAVAPSPAAALPLGHRSGVVPHTPAVRELRQLSGVPRERVGSVPEPLAAVVVPYPARPVPDMPRPLVQHADAPEALTGHTTVPLGAPPAAAQRLAVVPEERSRVSPQSLQPRLAPQAASPEHAVPRAVGLPGETPDVPPSLVVSPRPRPSASPEAAQALPLVAFRQPVAALPPVVEAFDSYHEALAAPPRRPLVSATRPGPTTSMLEPMVLATPSLQRTEGRVLQAIPIGADGRPVEGPPHTRGSASAERPTVAYQPATQVAPPGPAAPPAVPALSLPQLAAQVQEALDMDKLIAQVQRQLRRRLVIERERKRWSRWT